MAISYINRGSTASGTTSLSIPLPASRVNGRLMVLAIGNKHPPNGPVGTPTGWTAPANNQASGGAGANGVDSGPLYVTIFTRIIDGTESGNVSVTITGGNVSTGWIMQFAKTTGEWDVACAIGAQNTAAENVDIVGGSDPGTAAGDMMLFSWAVSTDGGAAVLGEEMYISQPGITFGAITGDTDSNTAGNDMRFILSYATATAGTSSGVPSGGSVFTVATSGAGVFVRLREDAGGAVENTLATDAAAYSLSGSIVTLAKAAVLTAAATSFSLSGAQANFAVARNLTAAATTYTITGSDVSLIKGKNITADATAYTLTGQEVALLSGKTVTTAAASYTLTGQEVAFTVNRTITTNSGAYTLTGQDVALSAAGASTMTAQAASYVLNGQAVTLSVAKTFSAAAGSYVLSGAVVTLTTGVAATIPVLSVQSAVTTNLSFTSTIKTAIIYESTIQSQIT